MPEKLRRSLRVVEGAVLIGATLGGAEIYRRHTDNSTNLTPNTTNELVSDANVYDREEVRRDAEGFQLDPQWETVDDPSTLLDNISDDLVVEANKYDRDRVARDAAGFKLDPEWKAVPDPRAESNQAK